MCGCWAGNGSSCTIGHMPVPPFTGDIADITGWTYSSGKFHGAADYPMPRGTPLYAVRAGVIGDCNDGVSNDVPAVPGAPSNWIMLWCKWQNEWVSVYYQHLSPGLKVHRGQQVNEGQLLGFAGDSGYATGPHLHIATMWGRKTESGRYDYMANDGRNDTIIYHPTKVWEEEPVTDEEMEKIARMSAQAMLGKKLWPGIKDTTDSRFAVTVEDALKRSYLGHDETDEV